MTEEILDFFKEFNLHTIITCIVVAWYFVKEMKTEMKAIESRLEAQISAQAARSDRLYEMFVDLLKTKQ